MNSRAKSGTNKVKAGDIVVVVLIVAAAAASLAMLTRARAGEKGSLAVIEVNGHEVKRFTLGSGQPGREVTVRGWLGDSTFEVSDGRVRMVSSTCRDKICVGTGWVDSPGSSIVCLPNRVVIRIAGPARPAGVDTVAE